MSASEMLAILPVGIRARLEELAKRSGDGGQSGRGALFAFAIRVVSAAIAFLSQIFLARWIGAHEYGVFTYVWVWINVIGTLATLGFATSVVRFIPSYLETGEHDYIRGFLRTGRSVAVGVGLLGSLTGLAVLYGAEGIVEDYFRIPIALGLVCIPAFALTDFQDGVGRANSWIDLALVPPYIYRPLLLLLFIAIAVLVGWERNAETAVWAAILATWSTAIVQYLAQKIRMRSVVPPGKRKYKAKLWFMVTVPVIMVESFSLLMTNMDVLLLKLYVTPDQIAIYFASARTIALIAFVHFAVTAAAAPRFSSLFTNGDIAGLKTFFNETRLWMFIPSLIGAVGLLALGKPLLWLFGPEFTGGYPVMFVLVIGLLARAAAGPMQAFLIATGQQNWTAICLGVTGLLNIGLNFLLIPRYGLMGAAAATAMAFSIESVWFYVISRRIFSLCDGGPK